MVSVDYLFSEDPECREISVGADPYTQNMRNIKHLGLLPRAPECGY